ncbi:MAG: IS66 family insertion sequence element accessory protein TnpA [Akkermansiaceae bacterium]
MNKQKRHKPEEIILLLREFDSGSLSQESFCQQKQISVTTLNRWRKKFGMMEVADAKRLKALEKENAELKKMYADAMLGMKILQETIEKSSKRGAPTGSCAIGCFGEAVQSAQDRDLLSPSSTDFAISPQVCFFKEGGS